MIEENLQNEIWRDIKGYEGYYQVSNIGRVKSLNRVVKTLNSRGVKQYTCKEMILRLGTLPRNYKRVTLCKDGVRHEFAVHRLVAQAFIPNPNNLPCVNHKDENPSNNCVDNLEWCTHKYNSNYGGAISRMLETKSANNNMSGWHFTDEQRQSISVRMQGHSVSEETREKIRQKLVGNTRKEETLRKQSESMKRLYVNGWIPPSTGKEPPNKGVHGVWIWVTNGEDNKYIRKTDGIPVGYYRGRTT